VPSEAAGLIHAAVLLVVTSSAVMQNPRLIGLVSARNALADKAAEPKVVERNAT